MRFFGRSFLSHGEGASDGEGASERQAHQNQGDELARALDTVLYTGFLRHFPPPILHAIVRRHSMREKEVG
jgi:hypothetical protein